MTTNDKMPDAIYAVTGFSDVGEGAWDWKPLGEDTKYTRADLADARVERLVEALRKIESMGKYRIGLCGLTVYKLAREALAQYEKGEG